jgi:6-phosphogluconolactonase
MLGNRKCAYTLNPAFGHVDVSLSETVDAPNYNGFLKGMPTMKRKQHETVVRKIIMLGAALTLLLSLPFAFANRAFADPTPKFAYVTNLLDNTVSAYTINSSTGALRSVAGSPFAAGTSPASVTVDPSGRFAYVANSGDNTVSAYTINSSTGALRVVSGSPFAAGDAPISVTVDPSGQFAYVANNVGNVSAYTISRSTGALRAVAGSPFDAAGDLTVSVTVDPSGRFAYVLNDCDIYGDCDQGYVSAYTINSFTGALSAVAGSPFFARNTPLSVTVDPSGRFAYVANACPSPIDCSAGNVSAYTINSSMGALLAVSGSPFAAGNTPRSMTVDPLGRFAYVANECISSSDCSVGAVSAYIINSSTGALRAVAGSSFPTGNYPTSVTVDPTGRFAYVTNILDNTVSAYTISRSTGALRAVAGSPFAAGNEPDSLAIAGQAVTTSVLTLAPRSLAFGNLPIHTSSAAQSVTVTNTSAKAVAITGIALRGTAPGQFAFTDDCGKSLAAYRTCTLEAIFKPTSEGAKTAFLDVNGGGGGLRSVKLTGTGT